MQTYYSYANVPQYLLEIYRDYSLVSSPLLKSPLAFARTYRESRGVLGRHSYVQKSLTFAKMHRDWSRGKAVGGGGDGIPLLESPLTFASVFWD